MPSPSPSAVWNSPAKGVPIELDEEEFPMLAPPWSTPKKTTRRGTPNSTFSSSSQEGETQSTPSVAPSRISDSLPTVAGILASYNAFEVLDAPPNIDHLPGVADSMHAFDRSKETPEGELTPPPMPMVQGKHTGSERGRPTQPRKRKSSVGIDDAQISSTNPRIRSRRSTSPVRKRRQERLSLLLNMTDPLPQPNFLPDSPTPPRRRRRSPSSELSYVDPRDLPLPNPAPEDVQMERPDTPPNELAVSNIFPVPAPPPPTPQPEAHLDEQPAPQVPPAEDPTQAAPVPMLVDEPPNQDATERRPHIPMRATTDKISYVYPLDTWEEPRGKDPLYWYDNLTTTQQTAWTACKDPAVLVRIAYEGCPTAETENARISLIEHIIEGVLVNVPNLMVTAPAFLHEPKTPRAPPFSYFVQGIDEVERAILEDLKCISTERGTIFITPKNPPIDTYIVSLKGIRRPRLPIIRNHINAVYDKCGLNARILSLVPSHPTLSTLPPDTACQRIRNSLRLQVTSVPTESGDTIDIVHIFMDPPTTNPVLWREFRDVAAKANFKEPMLGMGIIPFDKWRCLCCNSMLHPSGLCPIVQEPGWIMPPNRPAEAGNAIFLDPLEAEEREEDEVAKGDEAGAVVGDGLETEHTYSDPLDITPQ
ncbi:hypothetical protein BDW22DRAFT_1431545 [Trametopsis cervina]|nr:hypothetical protein BDW22DRAFT_1431545 [Trametopsis cervina]